MFKKILLYSILTTSIFSCYSLADLWWFTIEKYHVALNLKENGSMDVTETINVNFSEQRHGIYRELPTIDPQWERLSISNILLWVGTPFDSRIDTNEMISLKLANMDKYISWPHQYIIHYTIDNAIKNYSWRSELYWNVIGTKRNTTINNSSWNITLPKQYISDISWSLAVRWQQWEKNINNITFWSINENQTWRDWRLNTILQPYQGITIGLKFSSGYFVFPDSYEKYFINKNPIYQENNDDNLWWLFQVFLLLFIIIGWSFKSWSLTRSTKSKRKSNKPVAIQYLPPKDISFPLACYLRYYDKTQPRIFTAILYYRATKWRAIIKKVQSNGIFWYFKTDQYHIIETSNNPSWTMSIDNILLQEFFGNYDNTIDNIQLTKNSYNTIKSLLETLEKELNSSLYIQRKSWLLGFFWSKELSPLWEEVFEYMKWYKEYLNKVEQPVIELELKKNPDFINIILPWATLLGVESRLLKIMKDILANITWYESYDNRPLSYYTFRSMNSSFRSYSTPPRSSSGSWFWGGGWSSWGGGGWWWWWSC
jgi:Predicted membrane protein (DUF2207)